MTHFQIEFGEGWVPGPVPGTYYLLPDPAGDDIVAEPLTAQQWIDAGPR